MSAHWGSIPSAPEPAVVPIDKEVIMRAKNMEVEGPELHQPSAKHFPPINESYNPESFQLDSLSLHTIRLIQHARRLRSLIHSANVQLQELKSGEASDTSLNFPAAPTMPEYTGRPLKHKDGHARQPLPFLPPQQEQSDFVNGVWNPPPEIDHRTNRRLLRKSVAAVCAHTGFDNCSESVLETLTDVSHEYMLQMTRLLRRAVDNRSARHHGGADGFPDTIEEVFHEIGLGSMTNLHEFYQSRVIRYHDNMQDTCQQLMNDYDQLTNPDTKHQEDGVKAHRVKDEPLSDINFPSMDESEDGTDNEQVLQLDGLGLDIGAAQESAGSLSQEEDSKWSAKSESGESLSSYKSNLSQLSSPPLVYTPQHTAMMAPNPPPPPPYKKLPPIKTFSNIMPAEISQPLLSPSEIAMPTNQLMLPPPVTTTTTMTSSSCSSSFSSNSVSVTLTLRKDTSAGSSSAVTASTDSGMSVVSDNVRRKLFEKVQLRKRDCFERERFATGVGASSSGMDGDGTQGGDESSVTSEVARTPLSEVDSVKDPASVPEHTHLLSPPANKPPKKKKKI